MQRWAACLTPAAAGAARAGGQKADSGDAGGGAFPLLLLLLLLLQVFEARAGALAGLEYYAERRLKGLGLLDEQGNRKTWVGDLVDWLAGCMPSPRSQLDLRDRGVVGGWWRVGCHTVGGGGGELGGAQRVSRSPHTALSLPRVPLTLPWTLPSQRAPHSSPRPPPPLLPLCAPTQPSLCPPPVPSACPSFVRRTDSSRMAWPEALPWRGQAPRAVEWGVEVGEAGACWLLLGRVGRCSNKAAATQPAVSSMWVPATPTLSLID